MNPTLLLSLILLGASLAVAQQADAPAPSGAPAQTDALPLAGAAPTAQQAVPANELEGLEPIPGTNDAAEPFEPGQTNAPNQPGDEVQDNGRGGASRRYDGRQSRQSRFDRERQRSRFPRGNSGAGTDSGTNAPGSLDYAAFKVIVDLNIFDPNRVASGPRPVEGPRAEYFGLVGTAHLDKGNYAGTWAVFAGSGSQYEKVLKVSDSIAGYKIIKIDPDSVKLARAATNTAPDPVNLAHAATNTGANSMKFAAATNEFEMQMGQQMRREEAGPWQLAAAPSSYSASSYSSSGSSSEISGTASAAPSGEETDTVKKMMQRRAQEESK
ncbi:MAG: hypothetical protein ACLQM8_25595 [Limisphaerales bacterium]